jgi:hypothetical protein
MAYKLLCSLVKLKGKGKKHMKKSNILIAALAILAAASSVRAEGNVIDFDGKAGAQSFAQLAAQAQAKENPVAEQAIIPVRVFDAAEQASADKAIGSAITYAQKRQLSPALIAGLECLRDSGTPEQKAAFVNDEDKAVYQFPAACVAKVAQLDGVNKGIVDSSLQWLCESYNDVIEYLSCHKGPDGEEVCDTKLKTILRTSCHWG